MEEIPNVPSIIKRVSQFFVTHQHTKSLTLIVVLIVAVALPLTIAVSQNQQVKQLEQNGTENTIEVNEVNEVYTQEDVRMCHECGSTKYCGTTWSVSANELCTTPKGDIKENQPVCSCTGGTVGNCGEVTASQLESSCNPTSKERCTRCSDVYKYCEVTYDKNPNGECGSGDSASNKVYTLACEKCLFGTDYGKCGEISTESCKPSADSCMGTCMQATNCPDGYEPGTGACEKSGGICCANIADSCMGTCKTACDAGETTGTGDCEKSGGVCCTPSGGGLPNCDSGKVYGTCSGAAANTCKDNGTQSVTYKSLASGGECKEWFENVTCDQANCNTGYTCQNGICTSSGGGGGGGTNPTHTPTPTIKAGGTTPNPTTTPAPGTGFTVKLSIGLNGIGDTGDFTTPNNKASANRNPRHTTRELDVQVFKDKTEVETKNVEITYDTTLGRFTTDLNLTNISANDKPRLKIKTDGFLKELIDTVPLTSSSGATIITDLVNGDIDGDNEVSVLDYNIFVFCYYGYFCDDYYKVSDLNDNGKIDEIDYNLLLREYPAQIGD